MSNINGLDNEFEFVRYLNGKKVKELNPLMREVIDDIFNNIDDEKDRYCIQIKWIVYLMILLKI